MKLREKCALLKNGKSSQWNCWKGVLCSTLLKNGKKFSVKLRERCGAGLPTTESHKSSRFAFFATLLLRVLCCASPREEALKISVKLEKIPTKCKQDAHLFTRGELRTEQEVNSMCCCNFPKHPHWWFKQKQTAWCCKTTLGGFYVIFFCAPNKSQEPQCKFSEVIKRQQPSLMREIICIQCSTENTNQCSTGNTNQTKNKFRFSEVTNRRV